MSKAAMSRPRVHAAQPDAATPLHRNRRPAAFRGVPSMFAFVWAVFALTLAFSSSWSSLDGFSWDGRRAQAAVPSERGGKLTMPEDVARPRGAAHASGRKLILDQPAATLPGSGEAPGCHRLPAGRAIVKLNLKPETDIVDLVAWISSITCRQFLLPGGILGANKKVTVYAPQLITPDSAYGLFLSALDSVGLTVQKTGRFFRIIETVKVRSTPVPLYGFDGRLLSGEEDTPAAETP